MRIEMDMDKFKELIGIVDGRWWNRTTSAVRLLTPPNLTAVCWRPARMSFYHRSDVPTLMLRKSGCATRLSNCGPCSSGGWVSRSSG